MTNLGSLYLNGLGVAQDYAKARELYERAADKGDALAMNNVGVLYENGLGVAQDYAKARELFEKAADKGSALAMRNLGLIYFHGQGVAQDYVKAREWLEKAADRRDQPANVLLKQLAIRVAAAAGRYAEALQMQEALAVELEAVETKREGKPGEDTAAGLSEEAWFALFAGAYTKALAVANRAHAILPDNLAIESNRAHALMFLGRQEEAKALYLAYKGRIVAEDGTSWETAIASDFADFRKADMTHPMMADIEKELGISR
jgi:hypothetical protein